jgi:predicted nucleotidyltransferase
MHWNDLTQEQKDVILHIGQEFGNYLQSLEKCTEYQIWITGSYVTGQATEQSDYDLVIVADIDISKPSYMNERHQKNLDLNQQFNVNTNIVVRLLSNFQPVLNIRGKLYPAIRIDEE